jgi:KRAB domain-containing zinc finger protein
MLVAHEYIHTDNYPYTCDICKKKYALKKTFQRHMLKHLTTSIEREEAKNYKCTKCNKKFLYENTLKRHVLNHNKNVKMHECKYCDKQYVKKASLLKHYISHSTDRPFTCEFCNMKFKQKDNMQTHIRNIHHKLKEKNILCSICGKKYDKNSLLKKHMYSHTGDLLPFACNICDRRYLEIGPYNVHRFEKHNIWPYPCPKCEEKFKMKSELMQHLTSH